MKGINLHLLGERERDPRKQQFISAAVRRDIRGQLLA